MARSMGNAVAWLAIVALAAILFAGCGGSSSTPAVPTGRAALTFVVHVSDNAFTPATLTVPAGTSVTWEWSGKRQHSVVGSFGQGEVQSPVHAGSGQFSITLTTPGTWHYHSGMDGMGMSGTIIVN